jgi:hypothetical protein
MIYSRHQSSRQHGAGLPSKGGELDLLSRGLVQAVQVAEGSVGCYPTQIGASSFTIVIQKGARTYSSDTLLMLTSAFSVA